MQILSKKGEFTCLNNGEINIKSFLEEFPAFSIFEVVSIFNYIDLMF